jgi:hypothetical protein
MMSVREDRIKILTPHTSHLKSCPGGCALVRVAFAREELLPEVSENSGCRRTRHAHHTSRTPHTMSAPFLYYFNSLQV